MNDHVDHDELDLLSPNSPLYALTSTLSPRAQVHESGPRRSLRPRQSFPEMVSTQKMTRKRTLSTSATRNVAQEHAAKRAKVDEKKAQTEIINKKRDARDDARKQWLYCHRNVVEPMLPRNSTFFVNLSKEIERTHRDAISFKPMHRLDQQPKLIKSGEMKDYQLEGLSFLLAMYQNGMSCILGDEMGLGKTLQTLSLFAYIKENISGPHDPHLVICPLSVLSSWEAESARWIPSMRVIRFHGPNNERERLKHNLRGERHFDIMLTTYETYVAEDQWFKNNRWTYCVLDEGHKIKNADTVLSQKVQGLGSLYRLLLTGTPVQNNLGELWALLHWLLPTVFTQATQSIFKESFDMQRGSYAIPFLSAAKKLVSAIMLRRTKAVVAGGDVPPREELTVFIPLTETQRWWTYKLLTKLPAADLEKIFTERGETVKLEHEMAEESPKRVLGQVENKVETGNIEGASINLTKATTVIMCDSDWNPQNDLQAIARAHRIGQTKVVKVYRLICQGSVEDQMLDRIRRKLFLSYKIMGSDNPASTESTSLGSTELMDILRRGSSALSHSDSSMNLSQFLEANTADILKHSRSLEEKRDVKIKKDLEVDKAVVDNEQLLWAAEEEERKLLSGVAQVQSRLFEGRVVGKSQSNADIAAEWRNLGKRAREDRTIKIGGMTFIAAKETIAPPTPKTVKKARKKFESEEWCIHCRDGGELVLCPGCPRVFHAQCRQLTKADLRRPQVYCSQHNCAGCYRSTADCGGMLFRCRTCPQAFCEDCLPEGDLDAIGETLPEFLLLDYGPVPAAYYIRCHDCIADYTENSNTPFWVDWDKEISQAESKLHKRYAEVPRRALLVASIATSGLVLHTPPEKLSIYSTPTPDVLLVEESSALEREIGVVRRKVTEVLLNTHNQVQGVVSQWIGIEHAIENRVKSIISPNEPLTPGLLYVGVATLSGSILARNHMLATRLLLPPIFLFASAKHFLPQTTGNLTSYFSSLEDTYFPLLAEKHAIANAHTQMAWERLKDASQNGREWVNRGAAIAVDKVQESTGLKLNETLGWSQAGVRRGEAKASEPVKISEENITRAKVSAEKALDETREEKVEKTEAAKRLV
ncbi:hypothetical protein C0992_010819 [Termitomyces sp. T32_za158]|nr:hypothetical protein C0992_010819 [Termitomyces sp. T32_za158]